ncbi:putative ribonuclease H-like domain-containing protein, partial [Tanacetum coccineum]
KKIYSSALTKLIMRVKKLEHKVKTRQPRRRARVIISNTEEDLEDPSKQGRRIGKTSVDTEILLDQEEPTELVEDLGSGEKGEKEISTANISVTTASVTLENKAKKQLEEERLGHEEAIIFQEQINEEEKQRIARDAEIAKQEDTSRVICYEDVRPIFERVWDQNNAFVPKDSKIEKEVMKRLGFDFQQRRVFASVARIEAIRLFLAYASFKDFVVYQMDVKSAFLYRKIEEEVYVCQPPGFEDLDFSNRVYKVEKALYGLHQAPKACSMGELILFLKLQVQQKKDGIFISQDKYLEEILKKFGFTDVKTTSTPMETQKPLLKDENGEKVDVHMYRSMIGSLMYLTSSRPDIMFVVCACARYQVNPKVSHLYAGHNMFLVHPCLLDRILLLLGRN